MAYISVSSVEMTHYFLIWHNPGAALEAVIINYFDFVEFICSHSLRYSFACTVVDLQGFVTLNIVFYTLASVSHIKH